MVQGLEDRIGEGDAGHVHQVVGPAGEQLPACGNAEQPMTDHREAHRRHLGRVLGGRPGLVAAGLHPNPCRFADIVTTTTHKTLRGPRAGLILCKEKFAAAVDKTVFPGFQGGPLMHIIAAKAVAFKEAMEPGYVEYQKQVIANAQALAGALMDAGFHVVSNGTDTHLMLVDVFSKGIRGKEAEAALDRARITVNKNAIPFDVNPPLNPSGIRLGSSAVTTRGFREPEMREVGSLIAEVLETMTSEHADDAVAAVRRKVEVLVERFPLYAWRRQAVFAGA